MMIIIKNCSYQNISFRIFSFLTEYIIDDSMNLILKWITYIKSVNKYSPSIEAKRESYAIKYQILSLLLV